MRTGTAPPGGKGDGAGISTWLDEWTSGGGAGSNGTEIAIADGVPYLWMPMNGLVVYQAESAQRTHTWAEVALVPLSTSERPNPGPHNYNLDLLARVVIVVTPSPKLYGYAGKALREPDWSGGAREEPTLRVYRADGFDLSGGEPEPFGEKLLSDIADDDPNDACSNTNELKVASVPMIVRAEVKNGVSHPLITASVAWNCGASSCANECSWPFVDEAIGEGHTLWETYGQWALWSHHWDSRIDRFRAGSEPAP
jgi:hypothetical protein